MRKVLLCLLCFGLLTGCANAPKPSDNNDNDVVIKNEETTTAPETTTTPVTTTVPETTTTTEVTTTPVPETTKAPETTVAPEVTTAPVTTKTPATTTTTKPASSNAIAFEVEDKTIIKGQGFILMPPANVTYDVVSEYPDVAYVSGYDSVMGGYNIKAGYTGTSTITVTAHQAGHKDTTKKFKVTVELDPNNGTPDKPVYVEPEQKELAKQLFDLINDEREALGIPRWTWDEDMYEAASKRSRDDLPNNFEHNGPAREPRCQEEIGMDRTNNVNQLLINWKKADAHWYNMMNNGVYEGSGKTESPLVIGENRAAIAIWFNAEDGAYYTTIHHIN